jgi:methylphosphotriester-DNA--protein-cysteine methyltransferase
MLVYHEIPPAPSLSRYVDCFWSLEGCAAAAANAPERILPDGRVEIVFNLAEPFRRYRSRDPVESQPRTIVAGQMLSFSIVEPTGRVQLFGIRLRTGGACAIFAPPLAELTDRIMPLADLWHTGVRELEERVHEAASLAERARVAEDALTESLLQPDRVDALVEEAVRRILRRGGGLSTGALLRGMSIGERQLERRFREKVGLGPKQLARIIRFRKVLTEHEGGCLDGWSALAHDCGYYDQSHLIRDFKEFSGQSPTSYFRDESDFTRHLTRRHRLSDFSKTDV